MDEVAIEWWVLTLKREVVAKISDTCVRSDLSYRQSSCLSSRRSLLLREHPCSCKAELCHSSTPAVGRAAGAPGTADKPRGDKQQPGVSRPCGPVG